MTDPFEDIDVHPAAELFPLIEGAEFDALVADIDKQGQIEPIAITPDRKILDGRNRYRACRKVGVEPVIRVEGREPWAYVASANLHRRHLPNGLRSMIAAELATRSQGGPQGPMIKNETSYDGLTQSGDKPPTQAEAAQLLGVSSSSVTRAREVTKHGVDELIQAVKSGAVPVTTAARVAIDLGPEAQRDYAHRVVNGARPDRLASELGASSRYTPDDDAPPAPRAPQRNQWSSDRHRTINVSSLHALDSALTALDHVVKSAPDGLDPSLTPAEAAQWVDDLGKGRRTLYGVISMLKQRKESIQ